MWICSFHVIGADSYPIAVYYAEHFVTIMRRLVLCSCDGPAFCHLQDLVGIFRLFGLMEICKLLPAVLCYFCAACTCAFMLIVLKAVVKTTVSKTWMDIVICWNIIATSLLVRSVDVFCPLMLLQDYMYVDTVQFAVLWEASVCNAFQVPWSLVVALTDTVRSLLYGFVVALAIKLKKIRLISLLLIQE